eukprot:SAG11_NODE_36264_length_262_cov_1.257669_1_plen_49_part_01
MMAVTATDGTSATAAKHPRKGSVGFAWGAAMTTAVYAGRAKGLGAAPLA